MAAVARLVESAGDPRWEAPDAAGRRVIRATLPAGEGQPGIRATLPAGELQEWLSAGLLTGADLLLTLGEHGDVARMVVTSAPEHPELVLELDIVGLGETQAISPPDSRDAAVRRTVPLDELEACGVHPVELGQVPAGWKLTG